MLNQKSTYLRSSAILLMFISFHCFAPYAFSGNLQKAITNISCKISFAQRSMMDSKLKRYQTEFLNSYQSLAPTRAISSKSIFKRLQKAKLVLANDHHADVKSQAYTLELMQAMQTKENSLKMVIEWVEKKHQIHLDHFLSGRMSLTNLKNKIQFDKNWGFSWSSYSKILKLARELGVELVAVEARQETSSVYERDSSIAKQVLALRNQNPESKILVVYGTYHLIGKNHLRDKLQSRGLRVDLTILDEVSPHLSEAFEKKKNFDYLDLGEGHYFVRLGEPVDRLLFEYLYYESMGIID